MTTFLGLDLISVSSKGGSSSSRAFFSLNEILVFLFLFWLERMEWYISQPPAISFKKVVVRTVSPIWIVNCLHEIFLRLRIGIGFCNTMASKEIILYIFSLHNTLEKLDKKHCKYKYNQILSPCINFLLLCLLYFSCIGYK